MTVRGAAPAAAAVGVPSPCTNVCRIDPRTGWCEGCKRTLDEIAAWGGLDDERKRAVWEALARRNVDGPVTAQPADR